ncbi:periplasmic nitrate reductase chaperone NapD [Shewanella psychrophila]|uniref:Chaperone NapD n=1 Tax=Shewanella psychrophila TaxID=225848 RepID=A0A1S6HR68_9GAMM|nr:chaperone NapD [Shewanella psychrophila]AQS38019.1 periplasmic nitrate reductase chaperone NapD [Shewanella psychrophila]
MSQEYHVTSLVVHASPKAISQVESQINALTGTDIHAVTDQGKLVITLEGETQKSILDNVEAINALEGVLNSSLIYHQVDSLNNINQEKSI